mgnify:FL=1
MYLVFFSILFIAGCGGGGGGGGGDDYSPPPTTVTNSPPAIENSVFDISVEENQTSAFTIQAFDSDGDTLSYSLSGTDSSLMSVTTGGSTENGVVTFNTAPDFENPSDSNGNNVYIVTATVSDGSLTDSENFMVRVTNDTSDDSDSAWNGVLIKDDAYKPYDKHATSYGIIIGGLSDVTDGFMTNVANITNRILASNEDTNTTNRTTLIDNFLSLIHI